MHELASHTLRLAGAPARLALALVALAGCGSEPEFAETPQQDAGAPPPTQAAPAPTPTPTPAPTTPAPAASGPCDPQQSLALSTMMEARAAAEAPKMIPEGPPVCGVVGEGQTVAGPTVTLQPGGCYTILAQALPNVTEVDVQLEWDAASGGVPPAFQNLVPKVMAVDSSTGNAAAIGAKKDCYKNPWNFPIMTKLVVKSRTGSGPVAAQMYKKK